MGNPAFTRRSKQQSPITWAKPPVLDEEHQARRLYQPAHLQIDHEPRKNFFVNVGDEAGMMHGKNRINPVPLEFVAFHGPYDRSPVSSITCPDSPEFYAGAKHQQAQNDTWALLWNEWGEVSKEGTYLTKSTTHSDVSSLSDSSSSSSESSSLCEFDNYQNTQSKGIFHNTNKNTKYIPQPVYSSSNREGVFIPREIYFISHAKPHYCENNTINPTRSDAAVGEDSFLQSVSMEALRKGKNSALPSNFQERYRIDTIEPTPIEPPTRVNVFPPMDQFAPVLKNSSRKVFGGQINLLGGQQNNSNRWNEPLNASIDIEKNSGEHPNGKMLDAVVCRRESPFKDVKKHVRRRLLRGTKMVEERSNDEEEQMKRIPQHENYHSKLSQENMDQNYLYEESNGGVEVLIFKNESRSIQHGSQDPQMQQCGNGTRGEFSRADISAPKKPRHKLKGAKSLGVAMTKLFEKIKLSDVPSKVSFIPMESCFDNAVSSISSGYSGDDLINDYESSYRVAQDSHIGGRVPPQKVQSVPSYECTVHRVNVTNPEELEVEYDSVLPSYGRTNGNPQAREFVRRRELSAVSSTLWESQMYIHDLEGDNMGFLEDRSSHSKSSF